jgi:hypothetical protein
VVKRIVLAGVWIAASLFAAAEAPPTATISEGAVKVVLPDHVLKRKDVRKQLGSALTTTFLIVARSRQATADAQSRVEIRFDLWDEVYLVRRVERGRNVERRRFSTMAELEQWWRTPVRVIDVVGPRATVDLQLTVLPFSAADEGDARDWFRKSGGVGTAQTDVDGVVGAMIGTTIQARPIATYRWTIEALAERK